MGLRTGARLELCVDPVVRWLCVGRAIYISGGLYMSGGLYVSGGLFIYIIYVIGVSLQCSYSSLLRVPAEEWGQSLHMPANDRGGRITAHALHHLAHLAPRDPLPLMPERDV